VRIAYQGEPGAFSEAAARQLSPAADPVACKAFEDVFATVEAGSVQYGVLPIENSTADRTILTHVRQLATLTGAELLLVHVADGWAARHFDQLNLRESDEIKADRAYLEQLAGEMAELRVSTELAMGDPATELIRLAETRGVDLIAMSTHGHRFLNDLVRGTTVSKVRHMVKIPVLLLRAQEPDA